MLFKKKYKIKPPSVNNYYKNGRNGAKFISKEGVVFRKFVQWQTSRQKLHESPIYLIYNVVYKGKRNRDYDNPLKALNDAFNGILWVDDKYIVSGTAIKAFGAPENYFEIYIFDCHIKKCNIEKNNLQKQR